MKVAIIGGSGGIGQALVQELAAKEDVDIVHATFHRNEPSDTLSGIDWQSVDITREDSIQSWASTIGELDWLINAAGILHTEGGGPEKRIEQLDANFFLECMTVNALATLLLAKNLQKKFRHRRQGVFASISARVGSIDDNRLGGWYTYRSSKAALNMSIRTLAIEWKRTLPNVSVAAIHPGTTDTHLSRPYQRNVPRDKLMSPQQSAGCILNVLGSIDSEKTGRFWAYDGKQIPW